MVVSSPIGCRLGQDTHGLWVVVVTAGKIVRRYYSLDELSEKGIGDDLTGLLKERWRPLAVCLSFTSPGFLLCQKRQLCTPPHVEMQKYSRPICGFMSFCVKQRAGSSPPILNYIHSRAALPLKREELGELENKRINDTSMSLHGCLSQFSECCVPQLCWWISVSRRHTMTVCLSTYIPPWSPSVVFENSVNRPHPTVWSRLPQCKAKRRSSPFLPNKAHDCIPLELRRRGLTRSWVGHICY